MMKTHKKALFKIRINKDICKGCELCITACPKQCIMVSPQMNKLGYYPVKFVNEADCTGCGMCYQMCPDICIEVIKK
ncbi:MAG: 4Fe-4S dicluster domain-containing protein [bacterium]